MSPVTIASTLGQGVRIRIGNLADGWLEPGGEVPTMRSRQKCHSGPLA